MNEQIFSLIKAIADESPCVEHCGVIFDGSVIRLPNVHDDPSQHFMIGARDVLPFTDKNYTVWHTHTPQGFGELTAADIRMAKFLGRPITMVRAGDGALDFYNPLAPLPYEGRTWRTFHRNCYTLLQDWYRRERRVRLPDFFMDAPGEFDGRSPSKFIAKARGTGFSPISTTALLQVGDMVLTTEQKGAEGWHCSVVTALSPYPQCLSQWTDRPSGFFPYRAIANRVHSIWRYQHG